MRPLGHYRMQVGERSRGVRNRRAKLSPEKVAEIIRRVDAGETIADLAREFGVHHSTASSAYHRDKWAYD